MKFLYCFTVKVSHAISQHLDFQYTSSNDSPVPWCHCRWLCLVTTNFAPYTASHQYESKLHYTSLLKIQVQRHDSCLVQGLMTSMDDSISEATIAQEVCRHTLLCCKQTPLDSNSCFYFL